MDEVVGEAVVVIDDEDLHGQNPRETANGNRRLAPIVGSGKGGLLSLTRFGKQEQPIPLLREPYCPRRTLAAKRTASSAARNRARALATHSACSRSATESATTPAPACTYMRPSFTIEVRSTMQVSMLPSAVK